MDLKEATTTVAIIGTIATGGGIAVDQLTPVADITCDVSEERVVSIEQTLKLQKRDAFLTYSPLTYQDKATIKGCEIAKATTEGVFEKEGYSVEIVDVQDIEGGVQVFARAWKDGKQIAFGDGTVDIERFRIFNPPVLVPDENGDIVIVAEANEKLGVPRSETRYREDAEEALRAVVIHNISVMKNVYTPERIVRNKRGNTTSTFYPAAGASSPVDGWVARDTSGESWSSLQGGAGNSFGNTDAATANGVFLQSNTSASSWRYIGRSILLFNTASIGSNDTISSATFSVQATTVQDNATMDQKMNVSASSPASNSTLANGDYQTMGSTAFSTEIDLGSIVTSGYTDFALNASGLAAVSGTGITKLGVRLSSDLANVEPSHPGSIQNSSVTIRFADTTGTTQDPKLVVEHSYEADDIANDAVLSSGLQACYEMDETSGSRTDSSANGNTLTDNNTVTSASGVIGNAADFESTNSEYLSITDALQTGLDITGDISIQTWVTLESAPATNGTMGFMSKTDGVNDFNLALRYRDNSGTKQLDYFFRNTSFEQETYNTTLTTGVLYHVVFTLNMTTREGFYYINGTQYGATSAGTKTAAVANSSPFEVGNDTSGGGRYFDGTQDIVAIWNRVLTQSEVGALYNSGSGIPCEASTASRRIINIQ